MNTLFITLLTLFTYSLSASELSWVDEQVQAIKPTRVGMNISNLTSLKAPFIYLEKNQTKDKDKKKSTQNKKKVSRNTIKNTQNKKSILNSKKKNIHVVHKLLKLTMIMNNSVLINEKWYRIGETINGYKIKKINYNSVLLVRKSKKLLLSTRTDNKKLKFQK